MNVNDLPSLKQNEAAKQKYSYEDYLKTKQNVSKNPSSQVIEAQKQESLKPDVNKFSYEQYINNKNMKPQSNLSSGSNMNNNVSPQFNNFSNSYSRDFNDGLNFDISKPDQLRKTTIVAQNDYSKTEQLGDQHDNPYSLLSFNDYNPNSNVNRAQMSFSNIQPQPNYGNVNSVTNSMNNMNLNPSQSYYPSIGNNPNNQQRGFSNYQNNFSNQQGNINPNNPTPGSSSQLKFPR